MYEIVDLETELARELFLIGGLARNTVDSLELSRFADCEEESIQDESAARGLKEEMF